MEGAKSLKCVAAGERPGLIRTLAQAFHDDPALAWLLPDEQRRQSALERFFAISVASSFKHGEVHASANAEAVSLWYPHSEVKPGLIEQIAEGVCYLGIFRGTLLKGLRLADAMHAHHPKGRGALYLRYLAVSPDAQGQGWGGAALRHGIAQASASRRSILLETANPDNVGLYTRFGFEVSSEWDAPDGGPKFWTMLRPLDAGE